MSSPSRGPDYFVKLYAANPDPWDFAGSAYEQAKYRASLAALGQRDFESGFEIGCSIGIFTSMLAARCAKLLAADIVDSALAAARQQCAGLTHVRFENLQVPAAWPADQRFDLIICSEMLYFLAPRDIARVATCARASLLPGGCILLVNYTGAIDEPCSGDEAADIFIEEMRGAVSRHTHMRERSYRIDMLLKENQNDE